MRHIYLLIAIVVLVIVIAALSIFQVSHVETDTLSDHLEKIGEKSLVSNTSNHQTTIAEKVYADDAIHKAANQGNLDKVKEILSTSPTIDVRDSFGGTPLHAAMFQDNMDIINLLIAYGYDVNAQGTTNKFTPLHDAVWASNEEAIKILIENGADVTIENKDGLTPAMKAKDDGKDEIYELIMSLANHE